ALIRFVCALDAIFEFATIIFRQPFDHFVSAARYVSKNCRFKRHDLTYVESLEGHWLSLAGLCALRFSGRVIARTEPRRGGATAGFRLRRRRDQNFFSPLDPFTRAPSNLL